METIEQVRRQQQLRTLEQRRLEHTKEMERQRLHSRRAHAADQSWNGAPADLSFRGVAKGSPTRRNDYGTTQ